MRLDWLSVNKALRLCTYVQFDKIIHNIAVVRRIYT